MQGIRLRLCHVVTALTLLTAGAGPGRAGDYAFGVRGDKTYLNGTPILVKGLRCSNALVSEAATQELIEHLEVAP